MNNNKDFHYIGDKVFISKASLKSVNKEMNLGMILLIIGLLIVGSAFLFANRLEVGYAILIVVVASIPIYLSARLLKNIEIIKIKTKGYCIDLNDESFRIIKKTKGNCVEYTVEVKAFKKSQEKWFNCASFSDKEGAENFKKYHSSELKEEIVS